MNEESKEIISRLESMSKRQGNFEAEVRQGLAGIPGIQGDMKQLRQDVTNLQGDVTNLQGEMKQMRQDFGEYKDGMDRRLRRIERNIGDLEADMQQLRRTGITPRQREGIGIQPMFHGGGMGSPPEPRSRATGKPLPWPCTEKDMEF